MKTTRLVSEDGERNTWHDTLDEQLLKCPTIAFLRQRASNVSTAGGTIADVTHFTAQVPVAFVAETDKAPFPGANPRPPAGAILAESQSTLTASGGQGQAPGRRTAGVDRPLKVSAGGTDAAGLGVRSAAPVAVVAETDQAPFPSAHLRPSVEQPAVVHSSNGALLEGKKEEGVQGGSPTAARDPVIPATTSGPEESFSEPRETSSGPREVSSGCADSSAAEAASPVNSLSARFAALALSEGPNEWRRRVAAQDKAPFPKRHPRPRPGVPIVESARAAPGAEGMGRRAGRGGCSSGWGWSRIDEAMQRVRWVGEAEVGVQGRFAWGSYAVERIPRAPDDSWFSVPLLLEALDVPHPVFSVFTRPGRWREYVNRYRVVLRRAGFFADCVVIGNGEYIDPKMQEVLLELDPVAFELLVKWVSEVRWGGESVLATLPEIGR